jgi:hypothetical protein
MHFNEILFGILVSGKHFCVCDLLSKVYIFMSPKLLPIFQVLAANFVGLAWNVILSFKAHKAIVTK